MTVMVLWKEALSSLRGGSKGSETSDTYDLVFSNKTVLDPVRALPSLLLSDSLKPRLSSCQTPSSHYLSTPCLARG